MRTSYNRFYGRILKNNEQYLKSEGAQTPLVVLKNNHKNDKIMEKHDRIKDMNVDSAKPVSPPQLHRV